VIQATVIADSISPLGIRLTTMECTFHRFILSEFNTHRKFSRNSASSRAIPVQKIIDQVNHDTAVPLRFPHNQPGMVGGEDLHELDTRKAEILWRVAAIHAVECAQSLLKLNVHKSVVNRLLEPFMWHTAVVTSTEWDNFFIQRMSEGAQPEMRILAEEMCTALNNSAPTAVGVGGWHLPYVSESERAKHGLPTLTRLSVARVAGSSYNRLGKTRELEKDLGLYQRLVTAKPPHWSPFEHVATPMLEHHNTVPGNFDGWYQLRHISSELEPHEVYSGD
jgi:hypothetical protein